MMPKQVQNLRKRTNEIIYVVKGEKINKGEINIGDILQLFHENGVSINITVEATQEENIVIGKVVEISGDAPGIDINDTIVTHKDFVFVVTINT